MSWDRLDGLDTGNGYDDFSQLLTGDVSLQRALGEPDPPTGAGQRGRATWRGVPGLGPPREVEESH